MQFYWSILVHIIILIGREKQFHSSFCGKKAPGAIQKKFFCVAMGRAESAVCFGGGQAQNSLDSTHQKRKRKCTSQKKKTSTKKMKHRHLRNLKFANNQKKKIKKRPKKLRS